MSFKMMSAAVGAAVLVAFATPAMADPGRSVTVSVQNLAPSTSVAVSALSFAFHSGTYDPFNAGSSPSAAIVPIAELGSGTNWLPAFAAGDPGAVLGVAPGPLTPGQSSFASPLWVNTGLNQYFSFGAMVVPSNDHFIGNDSATEFRLFDDAGNLLINEIVLTAADIWDAGSETFNVANAAFIAGSDATQRIEENGVVRRDYSEFAKFDGLTTAAGYTFQNGLAKDTAIYRIHFDVAAVPEPATWAMMIGGFAFIGGMMRRRTAVLAPQIA
jgi:hypothetical protein